MNPDRTDTAEFSRPIDPARLGDRDITQTIEATAEECKALAARFGLVSLDSLTATLRVRRARGGAAVRVAGTFTADLAQACVVTLDPVRQRIEEPFEVLYSSDAPLEESVIGADTEVDLPEPLPEGALDLGETVAQQLSLSLDPYPRAPGTELDSRWRAEAGPSQGPFAGLSALKKASRSSG
jgi:uncharacterized metal-binding protein YceD (DUF177 family)